ncbi:hypothetical protein C1Y11_00320 [Pseudomonas sp. FW305-20]|nr:hypothetical protein C1Y11_00320 [Pseudomonas sp. FW305-20]PMU36818.1 hypothetical protein C1Y12_21435 [Pseudomonas sp. FW305-47B]PMX61543.1 hypothetical protein C1X12_25370 [Pseudomonas sp. FW305-60]PMX64954.1 hypothetical protein C1Y13_03095 [Pseudomonas sp. FW305-33]
MRCEGVYRPEKRNRETWRKSPPNVGASLLAIAPDQSNLMSPDTPLSRAGSLPQGRRLRCECVYRPEKRNRESWRKSPSR